MLAQVASSSRALIAADDTNRIIALSHSAVRLLGYHSAADLHGQRLVTIIPHRYRQAHIAGFILHLVAGRDPLLQASVTVPTLRADGSEITVELTVSTQRHQGRPIFLAALRAQT